MRLLFPLLVAVSLAAQPGQQPQQYVPSGKPGTVDGTVTDQVTHGPVRKATITIVHLQGNYAFAATTDAEGKFHIDNADPGKYMVQNVMAQGYRFEAPRGGTAFTVNEEEHYTGLKVELLPLGIITGKVVNDDGEPMRSVNIQAMTYVYTRGVRHLNNVAGAESDDRGEFRLFDLQPGSYVLRAFVQPQNGGPFVPTIDLPPNVHSSIPETGYPYTFYPNATDVAGATLVRVSPGSNIPGIDFQVHSVPVYHVRGKVTNLPDNQRAPVLASNCGGTGEMGQEFTYSAMPEANGVFDLRGLVAGTYCLGFAQNRRNASTYAQATVTVNDRSVSDVELVAQSLSPLTGTVTVTDQSPPPPRLRVTFQKVNNQGSFGAAVNDGKFELAGLTPDSYQVIVNGQMPNMYLKSIQYGSQEVPTGIVALKPEGGVVSLVLGIDAGSVSGTAQSDSGDPAASASITVVPDDGQAQRADLVRSAATDSKGSFQIRGLAPGTYKVYAWEDTDLHGLPTVADFRKQFSGYAASVTVSGNATATVQVKSVPAKESQPVKERF